MRRDLLFHIIHGIISHYAGNVLIKCSSWIKICMEGSIKFKRELITYLRLVKKFSKNL
jgi:hypothetical protein